MFPDAAKVLFAKGWQKGKETGKNLGLHFTVLSYVRIDSLAGCNSLRHSTIEDAMGKGNS